jgi:DNA (cytosine-5)-methyltransferase 1
MSPNFEDVLMIPKHLTKEIYPILVRNQWVARPWHLEGRYGSRTHKISDTMCGIPILPTYASNTPDEELHEILSLPEVSVVPRPITDCHRKPKEQSIDATCHPELQYKADIRHNETNATTFPSITLKDKEFTFIELFAGIGGFGIALEALGGCCKLACEIDERCRSVYAQNLNSSVPLYGDIHQIPDSAFPSTKDNIDLLVGGFPCQPFSSLGQQPGLKDVGKGQLYLQIVRALRLSQPKAFLLENVPGLLRMNAELNIIINALEGVGYRVNTELVSSRGLTATSRKRLFFVGLRRDIGDSLPFTFPFVPDLKLRAEDVIDFKRECSEDRNSLSEILHISDAQMNQLCGQGRHPWKPAKLAWPDVTLCTLDSHYGVTVGKGNSQLVPCCAPQNPRRFSAMECARLMGFPVTTFSFPMQREGQGDMAFLKEQYRMFGNAVCPPLVAIISGAILGYCRPDHFHAWVIYGRHVASSIAVDALLPSRREITSQRLEVDFP